MTKNKNFNFGEIWLADLNPRQGTESGKKRPVLIIQNQTLLDIEHPSTVILPLTTNLIDNAYPLRIRITAKNNLRRDSDIMIDQIRAIDNKRITKEYLTTLDKNIMINVKDALFKLFGFR